MKFKIAIPTIARAETIKNKTINYLSKTDIDFKEVDLFLSDGDELDAYKKSLKEYTFKPKRWNCIFSRRL